MPLGRRIAGLSCVVILGVLVACGGSQGAAPTQPTPPPTSTPTPQPTPTPLIPVGMVCDPTPPPMLRMHVKVHAAENGHIVLDSKPQVPNVDHYCDRVGFGNWRFCDTRIEGDPQRVACDYMAVGIAIDTGRWGPTWYYGDRLCSESTQCSNHPTEQFMARAKNSGTFRACAADDRPVAPNGTRCGSIDIN